MPKYAKVTIDHIFIKLIVTVIEKMQTSCINKQVTIKIYNKLDVIIVLELLKI